MIFNIFSCHVLFVPDMQCNLMSMGQLVEKGFSMVRQNAFLSYLIQIKGWCLDPNSQGTQPFKPTSMLQIQSVLQQQWLSKKFEFGI